MSNGLQGVKLSVATKERDSAISTSSGPPAFSTSPEAQQKISERLDEVESRLLFQEDLLSTLNDVIATQDMRMSELIRQLDTLQQQLKQGSGFAGGGDGTSEEPPPHY